MWYHAAWAEFQLDEVLLVTMEIVFIVVALSIVIGVPAAYALARRDFAGKKAILLRPKSQAIIDYGHLPAANKDVPVYTGASPLELSQAKVQYLQPE